MPTFRIASTTLQALLFVGSVIWLPAAATGQSAESLVTTSGSNVNINISQSVERLELLVKSSRILTLEERIPKFQVHNEEILSAQPISQNQIQISGKLAGSTQLNVWDTNDKLYTIDVIVLADAREVEGILASQLPLATLRVMPLANSAIISGRVTSVDDVDKAVAIVEQFYTQVVNNIQVVGVQQILLHTKIMEVSRTKLRELGIDWGVARSGGDSAFVSAPSGLAVPRLATQSSASLDPSGLVSAPVDLTNKVFLDSGSFTGLLRALRQNDLVKLLAEPTVVATHGRPARFTAGGKIPYVVPQGLTGVQVAYEDYGTSVDFLPFIVGPGRIRLEVRPEVSELDRANGIAQNGSSVPAFTQRYVETAVEMQAGQTLAIAGLLQSRTESTVRSTPFFGEIPVVGVMFRSVRERRNDIELLITVTPEIVEAMDPYQIPAGGPGLNSMSPSDKELYINGHIEVPNLNGVPCGVDGQLSSDPIYPQGGVMSGEVYHQGRATTDPVIVGEGVRASTSRK